MIRIVQGVYGHKDGVSVKPKTANDAPFSLPLNEERRLVDLGVAEYVGDVTIESIPEGWASIPEYNANMEAKDLRAIAAKCDLTFKGGTTKLEMVAALDQFFKENTTVDLPPEVDQPPTFDPSSAVQ